MADRVYGSNIVSSYQILLRLVEPLLRCTQLTVIEITTVRHLRFLEKFIFLNGVAAWRSGNGVGRINEVTLRRARLVLGWVTCTGSTPGGGTLFRYVTSHAGST